MREIIKSMYSCTTGRVWTKKGLTRLFESCMGVRQGDILSPLLFALFLNDLEENMMGGIKIGGKTFKILAYADDIVLLAPSAAVLQRMIICLEKYCDMWNLIVNLAKSKILIFKNGGRPAEKEKWWYKNERIEVVSAYQYLGILLTPTLNMEQHFKNKVATAKMALFNLSGLLFQDDVPFGSKVQIFNALYRSSVSYGAQVWGAEMHGPVEVLQKFFIKKVLRLPMYTPDFILYLETNLWPLFLYTLEVNLRYKNRCLALEESRYPHFLMQELINRKLFVYKDWLRIASDFEIPICELTECESNVQEIIGLIRSKLGSSFREKLEATTRFNLYKEIYGNEKFMVDYIYNYEYKQSEINWIFKVKTEIMYLNKYSFKSKSKLCSLCNQNEVEDVWHFVAKCPILATIRKIHLGKNNLDGEEFLSMLEKGNLKKLARFCKNAWVYRHELVREFNYW